MTREKLYLLVSGLGLGTIGLSYGLVPARVMPELMDVSVEGIDQTHVYRGVMGLYLGMGLYWVLGALRPTWARAAMLSVVFLMGGLAAGRVVSIVVDGVPSPVLVVYLVLELVMALVGIFLLRSAPRPRAE